MQSPRMMELVAQAQEELDTALTYGQATTDARQRLKLAQDELARVAMLEADQVAEEHAVRADAITNYVASLHRDQVGEIGQAISAILTGVTVPEIVLPPHTLHALVVAREAHDQALSQHDHQAAHILVLESRRAALSEERQHIVQRRATGAGNDEADSRLALIDADLVGLNGLLVKARAQAPHEHSNTLAELQRIERQWNAEKADALANALNVLVYQFEDGLIATAMLLRNLSPVGGIGRRYQMDRRLVQAAQRRLF